MSGGWKVGDAVVITDNNLGARRARIQSVGRKYFHAGGRRFRIEDGYVADKFGGSYALRPETHRAMGIGGDFAAWVKFTLSLPGVIPPKTPAALRELLEKVEGYIARARADMEREA